MKTQKNRLTMADYQKIESLIREAEDKLLEAASIVNENCDYKRTQKEFQKMVSGFNSVRFAMRELMGEHKYRVVYLKQGVNTTPDS